jgi:hypothetical protein
MAQWAELIFMQGPQQGARVQLRHNQLIVGRDPQCALVLQEAYASRKHFQLDLTAEGWLVENLSDRGTLINGKKFKHGKRVLLDTGDVLGTGAETEILFIAPGADASGAIAAYRSMRVQTQKQQQPPQVQEPLPEQPPTDEPASPVASEAAASGSDALKKYRKYIIFGGAYLAAMVVLIIFLASLKKSDAKANQPARLSERDISEAFYQPIERHQNLNIAAEMLEQARALWPKRNFRRADLQACVMAFKLHLAYANSVDFDDPNVHGMFIQARDELISRVQDEYSQAWISQQAQKWRESLMRWNSLQMMLPRSNDWDTPAYRDLQDNIMSHVAYVRRKMPAKRR